ncbi:YybH family protein [Flavihumibacter solisilvae]|uniref:L-asparaginase n=1 Tax=Flavihumibacter solisilvae TaxID=1349421 RepID=A0A0C1L5K1_9BACT|nr:nuclear transport factor 2 family protein [Flavihumibacter solisilvae]KIC94801.1 L-asparaginase [Flavihumibacter solisilvae]
MRTLIFALCILSANILFAQKADDLSIREVMQAQQEAWNKGDIETFMKGYWNSDSLMFIGSSGVTYGFNNTLERYRKTYNSREKMGTLKFDLLHVIRLADNVYMVVGKWHLTRTIGDAGGLYTLLFRKINDRWVIISDHTS